MSSRAYYQNICRVNSRNLVLRDTTAVDLAQTTDKRLKVALHKMDVAVDEENGKQP